MESERGKKILLVEDEAVTLMATAKLLINSGYDVITVSEGDGAVETVCNDSSIDLILMDIDLGPGINGPEAARRILEIKCMPIVFLTSHSEKIIVDTVKQITRYGYVIKNSGNFVLLSSIEMAFELFDSHEKLKLYTEHLTRSTERLSDVTNNMVDLVARLDAKGFFEYVSPSYERVLGYTPEELIGTWPPEIFHPSDREENIRDIANLCVAGEGAAEFRQRHKDGTYRWFEAKGRNIYDENGVRTGTVLGGRDITIKKLTGKKLRKKDKQYKELFENMIDGFAFHEILADDYGKPVDYIFLEVNPAFESYTGLKASDIVGKKVTEIIPDIEPYWIETYAQVAFTGVRLSIENFSDTLNKWFKVTVYSSERGYFATIFEDITDRKKAEELLKDRDNRYKRLIESVIGYVYTVFIENKSPVRTVHDPGCEAVTGYTPDDFNSDPELWYKMIYHEDRGRVILFASDIINKGIFTPIEHRIICRDGSLSWVRNTPVPHCDGDNNLIEYDSVIIDITGRKIAEIAIRESEERCRLLIDKNPLSIFILRDGKYIFANQSAALKLGYASPDEIIGVEISKTIQAEDMAEIMRRTERAMIGETNPPMELTIIKPDGSCVITETVSYPIILEDGPAVLVMGQDVTVIKNSFDKINSLLKEKDLLLHEVHHRIKNNMNTISGLLMLQAASMKDVAAVTALNDARSRVQSMMIMYDKLYRSEDFHRMSVKEYLEKFIDEIFMIFKNSEQVKIEKYIEDFVLDTKILFPLGIIINEIITNAFKYAFPCGQNGKIIVSVKKADDVITLTISDDGVGVPDAVVSSKSGGFGFDLVSALIEQLGGEFKLSKNKGTTVEFVFTIT